MNETHDTVMQRLAEGCLIKSFSEKYFLAVTPIIKLERVMFSIVKVGTNGKEHKDVYIKFEKMRQLCDDILGVRNIAEKKFEADKANSYPTAYQYVTGKDGSKKLSIGGGNMGVRVQIQVKNGDNWDRVTKGITMEEMREMAFLFNLIMGLVPVTAGSYYHQLYESFWNNIARESSKNINKDDLEETAIKDEPEEPADAEEPPCTQAIPKVEEDTIEISPEEFKAQMAAMGITPPAPDTPVIDADISPCSNEMEFICLSPIVKRSSNNGEYACKAEDTETHRKHNIVFTKEVIEDNFDLWPEITKVSENLKSPLCFVATFTVGEESGRSVYRVDSILA